MLDSYGTFLSLGLAKGFAAVTAYDGPHPRPSRVFSSARPGGASTRTAAESAQPTMARHPPRPTRSIRPPTPSRAAEATQQEACVGAARASAAHRSRLPRTDPESGTPGSRLAHPRETRRPTLDDPPDPDGSPSSARAGAHDQTAEPPDHRATHEEVCHLGRVFTRSSCIRKNPVRASSHRRLSKQRRLLDEDHNGAPPGPVVWAGQGSNLRLGIKSGRQRLAAAGSAYVNGLVEPDSHWERSSALVVSC